MDANDARRCHGFLILQEVLLPEHPQQVALLDERTGMIFDCPSQKANSTITRHLSYGHREKALIYCLSVAFGVPTRLRHAGIKAIHLKPEEKEIRILTDAGLEATYRYRGHSPTGIALHRKRHIAAL